MPSRSTQPARGRGSINVYGPRNRMLTVLALWVLSTAVFGPVVGVFSTEPGWLRVLPGVALAVLLAWLVNADYRRLQDADAAWGTGRLVVTVATAVLPPYVLAYLWKRGIELAT